MKFPFYSSHLPTQHWMKSDRRSGRLYPVDNVSLHGWEWYEPPQHTSAVRFCYETSLHGLQYVAQTKRHIFERVLWLVAFTAATITAVVLILKMWNEYVDMPLVTVFNPSPTKLNEIPFPAVTICNVNNVQKSKRKEQIIKAERLIRGDKSGDENLLRTFACLLDIFHICNSVVSLIDNFAPGGDPDMDKLVDTMQKRTDEFTKFLRPMETMEEMSQSCEDMILLCLWLDTVRNCSELFQGIATDYGFCCVFNMIPVSLLMNYRNDTHDDEARIREWNTTVKDYDDLIFTSETENRTYPYRQVYPGRSAGLSVLLDPDLSEYYCTNTDSIGFVVALNVPFDFPRMRDNGIAVPTSSEVFVSMRPEINLADKSTKKFGLSKRECYFGSELTLKHYSKYTSSNCIEECIADRTLRECGCLRFYMPHGADETETLCLPSNYSCTDSIRERIIRSGLDKACTKCLQTCTQITYQTETTSLPLRKKKIDDLVKEMPKFSKLNNLSVVHIYFNVDSVYPRLRKEMNTIIELISNAGGLLGLCMGFSMLSLLEVLYYLSVRLFCASYRKRMLKKEMINRELMRHRETVEKENQDGFTMKVLRPLGLFTRPLAGGNFSQNDDKTIFERVEKGQLNTSFETDYSG